MSTWKSTLRQTTVTSIVTWVLFSVAIIFADIMYLQLVMRVVDGGLLILAIAGAFALGGSVLILPRKLKNGDIKPGTQRTVAITVLLIDFAIMAANVIVAFAEKSGDLPPLLVGIYGSYIAPITPVIAALGIMFIWLADPLDKAAQIEMEVEAESKVGELQLRGKMKQQALQAMAEYMESPQARAVMTEAARANGMALLRDALGVSGVSDLSAVKPAAPTRKLGFDIIDEPIANGHAPND